MIQREWLDHLDSWSGEGIVSVVGPTGSGKSAAVAQLVERRWPTRRDFPLFVSVDAVSVYRGLEIGSAKPTPQERQGQEWLGLDLANASAKVTAADFVRAVLPGLEAAIAKGRPVLAVGGSHFYERALFEGMAPGAASDPAFQVTLMKLSGAELRTRLLARDERWSWIHENDRYRLTRYLDLTERQNLSYDELASPASTRPWKTVSTCVFGVEDDPEAREQRLRTRIQAMFRAGWIAETEKLLEKWGPEAPALGSVGYREIVAHLRGQLPADSLEEAVLIAHQQLAKKQRTWLRGLQK